MQAVQLSTSEFEITEEITAEALERIDFLAVDFQGNIGGFGFAPDAFAAPFTAQVDVSTANTTAYPDDPDFSARYPAENVTAIGPLLTLAVPYSALRRNGDPAQKAIAAAPALYQQYRSSYEPTDPLGVEVRILRPDGTEDFYLEDYIAGGQIVVLGEALDAAFADGTPPSTLTISFQPVDLSRVLTQP